jgi:5-methyltetrahydrofolate--homocysteine methyltransferase
METRKYTNRSYLDALEKKVLVFDGAMGTNLQQQPLTAEDFGGEKYYGCNDFLVISHPVAVEAIHRAFLDVGVDVLETDTFRSNRLTLGEYGLAERTLEINTAAAALARKLADEYTTKTDQPRFVAGSIGPSGKLPSADDPDLSNIQFDELVDIFREQSTGLIQGGVDLVLLETSQDILELKAAIHGVLKAFEETGIWLPIQAQVTLDTTGRMLLGTDITAVIAILEDLPIDVIGLNCSTGPEHMREPIRILGENTRLPVSCIPNAGLPLNVDGQAVYPLEPESFASALYEFIVQNHISVVGGCCGTTPGHLKKLVEKVNGLAHPPRPVPETARLASGIRALNMQQDPPPFLIGERCNAQGSRAFKRLLLAEEWDAILAVARDQTDNGAHGLDISVAVTERGDEPYLMRQVVRKLVTAGIDVPLVIDTTEVDVLEVALKTAPGRCLINSTHLESGRAKADMIFDLARSYNAAVIVLTIDEAGMAKTRERKLEVARRIYDIAVNEHGLRPDALVFDALTFTLATGDPEFASAAVETIEGIRLIKDAFPGVLTSLGVSNLSFGLSANARPTLNSVMLYHCVKAGLDMAIVNPAQIKPYVEISPEERDLAEDLIFNRRPDALQRYIEYFSANQEVSDGTAPVDPTAGMTVAQRLHWRILSRHKENIEADVDEIVGERTAQGASSSSEAAVDVLNTVLLPAMKEVGDKFGAGELILPFVLQSAEVMKKAVAHLEGYLDKQEGVSKGLVVLATVYGDVHDIGKNLVKTILSNNGYEVIDLGKQVPAETIITRAVEVNATAIGLSALLVSTSRQMPLIVNELQRRGLVIPVLIGGAAINRRFGRRILFTEDDKTYEPGVYYCKDAFEGLETMDQLIVPEKHASLRLRIQEEAELELGRESGKRENGEAGQRSGIVPAPIDPPQTLGQRVVQDMPLELVFEHLNLKELYRLSWGAKNAHGPEWEKLKADFETRLKKMKADARKEGWLKPQAVYGFFPCQADGDDLIIYDPDSVGADRASPLQRLSFPRQPYDDHLALSDYFSPVGSGRMDFVAFQVVTVGHEATEKFDRLQAENNYSEAYYVHGLAVQTAEATADYLHYHIRRELGLSDDQGKRYSWGYPAIPELADHRKVFDLLPAVEKVLKMQLSPAFQLIPEQSTAAIIVHHAEAKYFSVGGSRVEQLLK